MGYSPPDSIIIERIQRAFPSGELRERVAQRILLSVSGNSTLLRCFTLLRLALLPDQTALYRHFSNGMLRWLIATSSPMHRFTIGSNQALLHSFERFSMMLSRISILDEEI
jgi:hypothetical protein